MEFKSIVRSRRSCRSFEPDTIPEDQLQAILEAGQWAPSPLNALPWHYIIVTDAELKTRIREVSEAARQTVIDNGGPGFAAKYDMHFIEQAPVVVAVVYDPAKNGLGNFFNQEHGALQAASACVQNMMLAATEFGLGTLFFTWFEPNQMRTVLSVPDNLEIAALVPIGKPKGQSKAPPRKDPRIHREQFNAAT